MLRLGEKVTVVEDTFEQNLPIGHHAYIIAYDRNPDNAFDYVIRIPSLNRNFFVPAADIELESVVLKQEAERVEREALIDFALSTYNEKLFFQVLNGELESAEEEEETAENLSQADFIKQVNLRAWI
ncbi:ATPase [Paenibacillus faecalis]|uniref:ATPase n=1 Tax=Paenibacillus faecalis TaxID=2079532 RepID=UPI000D0FD5AF|nr:ATPase [Paenibacillus faecalis]